MRGGARPGAGRPPNTLRQVVVKLDPRHAQMLAVVSKALAGRGVRMTPDAVVALLIEQAYAQLREMGGTDGEISGE
jgi:hypothetical protein